MDTCYEYPVTRAATSTDYKHQIKHIQCLEERLNAMNGGGDVDLSSYITKSCADNTYSKLSHSHNNYALISQLPNCYASISHNHDGRYSLSGHGHSNYALSGHNHAGWYACVCHCHCNYYNSCTVKCLPTRLKRLEDIVKAYDEYLSNITPDLHLQQTYPPCSIYYAPTIYYLSAGGQTFLETKGLEHWAEAGTVNLEHENTVISE
jgi:hypothetical protein